MHIRNVSIQIGSLPYFKQHTSIDYNIEVSVLTQPYDCRKNPVSEGADES